MNEHFVCKCGHVSKTAEMHCGEQMKTCSPCEDKSHMDKLASEGGDAPAMPAA